MFILISLAVWTGLVGRQGQSSRWPCPLGLKKGCNDVADRVRDVHSSPSPEPCCQPDHGQDTAQGIRFHLGYAGVMIPILIFLADAVRISM